MNSITPRRWELKLGVIQAIALLGAIFGSLACTFYLGFSAGRTTGHEQALAASLAASPKVSLRPDASASEHAVSSRDIFAKLDTQAIETEEVVTQKTIQKIDKDAPEVSSIPIAEVPDVKTSEPAVRESVIADMALEQNESPARSSGKTLADLETEKQEPIAKLNENSNLDTELKTSTKVNIPIDHDELKPLSETSSAKKVEKIAPTEIQKAEIKPELKKEEKVEAKVVEVKKQELPKVEPTPKVKNEISKGWFAQVAAPQEFSDAQAIISKLKSSGFKASIENATVRGESYYRILVGPEEKKEQAERLVQQLQRESYLKGAPFLRFVK